MQECAATTRRHPYHCSHIQSALPPPGQRDSPAQFPMRGEMRQAPLSRLLCRKRRFPPGSRALHSTGFAQAQAAEAQSLRRICVLAMRMRSARSPPCWPDSHLPAKRASRERSTLQPERRPEKEISCSSLSLRYRSIPEHGGIARCQNKVHATIVKKRQAGTESQLAVCKERFSECDADSHLQCSAAERGRRVPKGGTIVGDIRIDRPEVHVVEQVDEIETQLKITLFAHVRQVRVLQQAGIDLDHTWIAIDIARLVAFRAGRWSRKVSRCEQSLLECLTAVRARKVSGGRVRHIPVVSVQVVVASEIGSRR